MFGEQFKKARQHLGLSRSEVAEKVGLNASSLTNIEHSKTIPGFETINNLCEHLNLDQQAMVALCDAFNVKINQRDVDIGKQIKKYRQLNNLTQMDLAKALGYTSSASVSLVEQGKRGASKDVLLRCCKVFNIHAAELLAPPVVENNSDDRFYQDVMKIISSPKKPATYDAIKTLVSVAAKDLR